MFSRLYNEAVIEFDMHTESPLFIKSGLDDQLNPAAVEHTFFVTYKNGEPVPAIPGSSLKGVFRSTAEQLLKEHGVCNILSKVDSCSYRIRQEERNQEERNKSENQDNYGQMSLGEIRYKKSCPVCKLFGSQVLKSRITFNDACPVGEYKTGKRAAVAIDRITGASRSGALYDFEYIENAVFKCRIQLRNFFRWQVKLIFEIFNRIDDGYTTFGGFSSKGFGRMRIENVSMTVRYYDKGKKAEGYSDKELYIEKNITGREAISELLKDIKFDEAAFKGCDLKHDKAL
ncbi:CRISPR-associated RAMP protein, SSO1426 family [Thermoclostridium stercorarium subsp. stercorarium DSM 8532]|jgi:CRISPR-associated protein Csm3|uniref:CRISPR-associated RAMP protein, SSO1426 family n=2 Tax=Thermoclostridium stercorarium TaxID=1510 RepID=L7VKZ9_THES1|nr:CRISPR-associated RAMP protein Csx7 [Thermoclostridium stercorarium]AGC67344.1 CRISPR-associated RAMP protein, SSO1426 family [Thermoclostridium stercorarium subsp. stercorarium DSM 8532]AGI38405.1 CRISPR RAMP protein [Thermoclostridium stercorarium subsp. stercorarium DSM 8532]ANW97840.1 CRISPR-associated protein Csm3 [Thermoclostridium stercorarium subsp. thermolacticum DSM 2910]UZQ85936.1 CRISPR-associated RAMP protein Csx7 [Thermoclostridium stercorarium]